MILDVAETVSGYFGFDRSIHGNKKNYWTKEMEMVARTETRNLI
jgi:hypothetical protein